MFMTKPVTATVLVVEDEQVLRTLVRTILEQEGYTVLQAADGYEAVRLMNQPPCPVNLLITDVVMPGLSGRQVAEKVLARHPGLKVLYISGYNEPFTPSLLSRRVREMLSAPISEGSVPR